MPLKSMIFVFLYVNLSDVVVFCLKIEIMLSLCKVDSYIFIGNTLNN